MNPESEILECEKEPIITASNKKEIFYNLVNSALAGGLVFLGSLTAGNVSIEGICAAVGAAGIVAITKFSEYWKSEKKEYSRLFNFF